MFAILFMTQPSWFYLGKSGVCNSAGEFQKAAEYECRGNTWNVDYEQRMIFQNTFVTHFIN